MKQCTRCEIDKPYDDFFNDKHASDGKCPACKACVYKRRKEPKPEAPPAGHKRCNGCKLIKSYAEFYLEAANKADGRYSHCKTCKTASTYAWRAANKETYNASMREYHKKNYGTERLYRYNLSREDYNAMLASQKGLCAICSRPNPSIKRCLVIDHCHATGKVRGILCYGCNRLMVLLDDEELLQKAIAYKRKAA